MRAHCGVLPTALSPFFWQRPLYQGATIFWPVCFCLLLFCPLSSPGLCSGFAAHCIICPLMRPFRLSNAALLQATGLAFGVPAALIAAFWLPFNPCIPPSDETLLAAFRRNETELNQIARMIKRDKGLRRDDDLASYRHRLHSMGIGGGHYFPENDEIQFYNWITGSALSSDAMKGFAYLSHPPKKTQKTLNNYSGTGKSCEIYRHIKGHWYLFYRFIPG